jgi:hypothetical protein
MKLLHFADAHIDMANYGRHDPVSGLPLRVLDFLKSLDTIVDTAIERKVDLVIFAGMPTRTVHRLQPFSGNGANASCGYLRRRFRLCY